jgi:hypothetical protein
MPYNFTTEIDQRFLRELRDGLESIEQMRQGVEVDQQIRPSQRSLDWLIDMREQLWGIHSAIARWIQDSEFRP